MSFTHVKKYDTEKYNFYEILIEKLTSQLGKVWLEKENLLIELN